MSELVEASGVPLPTIKYYLREGLLQPGETVSATRASYGEEHVRRLAVIRALIELVGLPVARVREVLAVIDTPGTASYETVGRAISALPPYPDESTPEERAARDHPLARAAIERLGWTWDPRFPAVAQLERALAAAGTAGIPMDDGRLEAYGTHLHAIAETEIALGPDEPSAFLEYAVLGTALTEPVILALRRLAHQDVTARRTRPSPPPQPPQPS
jgi:DNA-binding transcriptional MerR regulator